MDSEIRISPTFMYFCQAERLPEFHFEKTSIGTDFVRLNKRLTLHTCGDLLILFSADINSVLLCCHHCDTIYIVTFTLLIFYFVSSASI